MKFGSSITFLKGLVVKGMVLSFIYMAEIPRALAVAVDVTVNSDDPAAVGSLRNLVETQTPEIRFTTAIFPNPSTLTLTRGALNLGVDTIITASSGLMINAGVENNLLFLGNNTLALNGNDSNGYSNWRGDIVVPSLEWRQLTNAIYIRNITGRGAGSIVSYNLDGNEGATLTLSGENFVNPMYIAHDTIKIPAGGRLVGPVNIGAATLEMNGGSVEGEIHGISGSELNVTGDFTATHSINNVETINVDNGTFTVNAPVQQTKYLNVNTAEGTLLLSNNNYNYFRDTTIYIVRYGTIIETGGFIYQMKRLLLSDLSVFNLTFTNSNPRAHTQFNITERLFLYGGEMKITLLSAIGNIYDGAKFNILNYAILAANAVLPTVTTDSLFLSFTPILENNSLKLVAHRIPISNLVDNIPVLAGVAENLDSLTRNPQFTTVFDILGNMRSEAAVAESLNQLVPMGLDDVYTATAQGSGAADSALLRLDTARAGTSLAAARIGYARTGYAAGDMMENQGSYGPIVFGNSATQASRNGLPGYKAVTAGFGFLGDVPILDYFRVGLGVSYANSAIKQSNNTGSNLRIGMAQGLAYGSASYGPLFLDGVLSLGMNNYHGKRNMPLFNQTATSAYTGFQYGAKLKGGFTIPCGQAEISPTAGVQYLRLNIGQYTEKGAGILNQQVNSTQIGTARVSLGARIADRSQEEDFFPEIHAFYIVDVSNPQVLITSRFVEGGGSFVSRSASPPKAGITLGASLTALVADNFVLSGGYDLEAKKSFRSHSASLKFKFLF